MCKYILYIDFTQSRRYCLQLALNNAHIRVKGPLATQKDIAYDKRIKPGNINLSLLAYVLCEKKCTLSLNEMITHSATLQPSQVSQGSYKGHWVT